MGYQPPSIQDLMNFIKRLPSLYTGARQSSIELIQNHLPKNPTEANRDQVLGLLIYVEEKIKRESFAKRQYGMFKIGSELAKTLRKGFDPKHELDRYNKLIYLQVFNRKAPQDLHKDIEITQKKLVAEAQDKIEKLLKRQPSEQPLLDNFALIPRQYSTKKIGSGETRSDLLNFLNSMELECRARKVNEQKMTLVAENSEDVTEVSRGYLLRKSAMVYVMAQIEAQYTLTSPKNSELYKICQRNLHIAHTCEISALEKWQAYWALCDFIPMAAYQTQQMKTWKNSFKDCDKFFIAMHGNLIKEIQKAHEALSNKPDPHPYLAAMRYLTNLSVKFALGAAVASTAGAFISIPLGLQVASAGLGAVGQSYYGYMGAVAGRQAGSAIERGVVSNLAGLSFRQVGSSICDLPGHGIYYLFLPPALLFNLATSYLSRPLAHKPFEKTEYILTLLELSDDVFSAQNKEILRETQPQQQVQIEDITNEPIEEERQRIAMR
jgi:hypothetical protein